MKLKLALETDNAEKQKIYYVLYVDKEPTVIIISDNDQRLLLLANQGAIWRLALGCSQNESELLLLFMDGVVHQADHTGLLGFTWRQSACSAAGRSA